MTTSTFTNASRNHECAWMKSLHDALIACGLTQTADTGQLSLSSAPTWVATISLNYGYTVYRWADTQHATLPLFMKVTWLNGTDVDGFALLVEIGGGSNGSGTITGSYGSITLQPSGATTQAATTFPSYVCFDGTALAVSLFETDGIGTGGQQKGFVVDRFRNNAGVANGAGFVQVTWTTNANLGGLVQVAALTAAGVVSSVLPYMPYYHTASLASQAIAGDIPVAPVTILSPALQHVLGAVGVPDADVAQGATFAVTHLGAAHTYRCSGKTGFGAPTAAIASLAYLWE